MIYFKNGKTFPFWQGLLLVCLGLIILIACNKNNRPDSPGNHTQPATGKKKNPPPPPSAPFYFSNCSYPNLSGTFRAGQQVNMTLTMNYVNSPGGNYAAFTSNTVNGIVISAPAGTFNTGSGTVVFNVTGTPTVAGYCSIIIALGNIVPCNITVTVLNSPANPATCGGDPGTTPGSVGCVTFPYQGQNVTYYTVRARDGKIWLQQNLGSPQVAMNPWDPASNGHYFQWGRWDDGHQLTNSPVISANASLQNPSHIPGGNPNFIWGSTPSSTWWSNGVATDTWNGSIVSSTNGKNPCAVLGAGWRMPTIADWQSVVNAEGITSQLDAYASNLKLPMASYRTGSFIGFSVGAYWSSTATANGYGSYFWYDESNYQVFFDQAPRTFGVPCRCVKD